MGTEELKLHPRGQVAFGSGELQKATLARFSVTRNGKLKHTLRRSPSGTVQGTQECTGSIEIDVDEDGLEADWYEALQNGERVTFRYKMPTLLKQIDGILTSIDTELPLDDAVKLTVNWTGQLKPA